MLSVGYSANGLLGGHENPKDLPYFKRSRQWLLSLDIDLQKIPVKNKLVKSLFSIFNIIKIPMPTLLLQDEKLSYYALYF